MIKMNRNKVRPCDECLKINTFLCPNSSECFSTEDKPHFRNRMMLLKENKQLQNNWNELKEFVEKHIKRWEKEEQEWIKLGFMKVGGEANNKIIFKMVQKKMQELEGNNEKIN